MNKPKLLKLEGSMTNKAEGLRALYSAIDKTYALGTAERMDAIEAHDFVTANDAAAIEAKMKTTTNITEASVLMTAHHIRDVLAVPVPAPVVPKGGYVARRPGSHGKNSPSRGDHLVID